MAKAAINDTRSITQLEVNTDGTNARVDYILSCILAAVAAFTSAAAFSITDLFQRDNTALAGCARGTALVILVVAVPVLVAAMLFARQGSVRARLVWLGMVIYILYNAGYFAFSASFNRLFLAFIAMLALAFWSLLALLVRWPAQTVKEAFGSRTPVRFTAAVCLFPVLIFAITDLRESLIATIINTLPPTIVNTQLPTNHFHVMDLAFLVPAFVLAAVWLWQRRSWGYTLAGSLLAYYTVELLGIGVDQWYGGRADPTSPLADAGAMPVFVGMAVVMLAIVVLYLRAAHR